MGWDAVRAWLGRLGLGGGGSRTKALGARGEQLAAAHLRRQGYRVLARNARVPFGEADLVCEGPDGRTIVLVEVKTRADADGVWTPEHSIDRPKRAKLTRILRHLVKANRWHDRPARIDVIAIEGAAGETPRLRHHENAVATSASSRGS